ncbi:MULTISPECIES: helix-turn-helix domain-containing protein [Haloferax]|uniref:HTH DNA binding domain protein n=1 Tax=Haloferax massiliensis TaxID=1476858 RepID=A0A0D6JV90_9EURY|nr:MULTISPECIES: helix-turn-helix domain-containing protein [Haloferax]MDS0241434.1 helix-turn-helix domain-containing protein [Haloferax sp. S2CR25]MDS0444555.1 helix-turn-helix domain-containing protein [Haloferax sp. S2CR25-2]CQR52108.1 HTH DNA binding domain protein [Haloferax massiliensis]
MTLEDRLTPRQLEVLQTAYESGYFESPRAQTGTDLAAVLDISQAIDFSCYDDRRLRRRRMGGGDFRTVS